MGLVEERAEGVRGCGWRKPGGLYFVTDGHTFECGILPIEAEVCPCCGEGIRPSRALRYINPQKLVGERQCLLMSAGERCWRCWEKWGEKAILMWIGEKFYPTANDWSREARRMGVSRRISGVPREYRPGMWVLVGHKNGVLHTCCADKECERCEGTGGYYTPAVFSAFKPKRIEYVVRGDESEEKLKKLKKRGVTPVRIRRLGEQDELPFKEES